MATHSSFLAWEIPWTEEPSTVPSMESKRVRTQRLSMRAQLRYRTIPSSPISPSFYPLHYHLPSFFPYRSNKHSSSVLLFTSVISGMLYQWILQCVIFEVGFFTQHNLPETHASCVHQQFMPFYCQLELHHMDVICLIFTCCETFWWFMVQGMNIRIFA